MQLLLAAMCGIIMVASIHAMNVKKKYHIRNGNVVRSLDDAIKTAVTRYGKGKKIAVGMTANDPVSYSTYIYTDLGGMYQLSYVALRLNIERSNLALISNTGFNPDIVLLWDNGTVKTVLNDDKNKGI